MWPPQSPRSPMHTTGNPNRSQLERRHLKLLRDKQNHQNCDPRGDARGKGMLSKSEKPIGYEKKKKDTESWWSTFLVIVRSHWRATQNQQSLRSEALCGRNAQSRCRNWRCSEERTSHRTGSSRQQTCYCGESSERSKATWKAPRDKNPERTGQVCRGRWNTQVASYPRVREVATGESTFEKDCTARNRHKSLSRFVRKESVGEEDLNRTREQNESQIQVRNLARDEKNMAECFIGASHGVLRAREIRRLEPQSRWDREAINSVIGMPWMLALVRWTMDKREVRVDPIPIPPVPFAECKFRRKESQSKTSISSAPLWGVQVATRSKTGNTVVAKCEWKNASRSLHKEQKDWTEEMMW